jgi:hypothetical protein
MVDVVLVDVLYTKVIDNEGKADGAPCMCPISRGDLALTVSGNEETFLEEFLSENAGLGKAVHASLDFAKDVAVGIGDVLEVVFFNDVFGKQVELHSEVLVPQHWRHEVEIFEVYSHEFCIQCGYDAVEEYFDGDDVGSWGTTVVRIIDKIAAHGDSCAIRVLLF